MMTMTEIRVAAKMDTRACLLAMQGLVLAGTVVRMERVTALRGRKGFLYARAAA
jgi:hypothetical protein